MRRSNSVSNLCFRPGLAGAFPTTFGKIAASSLLGPGALDVAGFIQVANLYGVHSAAPREKYTIDLVFSGFSAHDVDLLMVRIQKAAGLNVIYKLLRFIIFGFQLRERFPQLDGKRADARMPLLFCVTLGACLQACRVGILFVFLFFVATFKLLGSDPSLVAAHVWEAHCIGMQEDSLAPLAVLDHLLGLLVIELRNNRRAESGRHV